MQEATASQSAVAHPRKLHDLIKRDVGPRAGAPITLVSATLGHANLKTTSVYAHARPGESSARYLKTKF